MSDRIEFHPRLVEGAVWAAVRGGPHESAFHREREPVYELADPEARDQAFVRVHASWFGRLGLEAPVRQAFLEQRTALAAVDRCVAGPAVRDTDQGVELFVSESGERSIVLSIRPETLVDASRALRFLRRELLHIADILDPEFRYEPRLPRQPAGPAQDRLLQDRYRVLWDCSVDGRLAALGLLEEGARRLRFAEFGRAFACLGELAEEFFERLFDGRRPDHFSLVAMASDPEAAFAAGGRKNARGRCALCGFPTADFEPPDVFFLEKALRDAIKADFPAWREEQRVCRQCADLYRARPLSAAAADRLPGSAPPARS